MKQDVFLDIQYDKNGRGIFSISGHDVTDTVSALIKAGRGDISEDARNIVRGKGALIELGIRNAEIFRSNLSQNDILRIPGMSSQKIRHFLNLICSSDIFLEKNYFEIGCASGSTYISSNFNSNLNSSYVCDLFLEEKNGPDGKSIFLENCMNYLGYIPENIFSEDCFKLDLNKLKHKINIYFYDGDHSIEAHEKSLTYFEDIFDDIVLVMIDDWDDWRVQLGTLVGLSKINYDIVTWFSCKGRTGFLELNDVIIKQHGIKLNKSEPFGDVSTWWNGLLIMVLKKSKKENKI